MKCSRRSETGCPDKVTVQPGTSHCTAKSVRKHSGCDASGNNSEAVFARLDACNRKPKAEPLPDKSETGSLRTAERDKQMTDRGAGK
ncbi:MAG: hypothetical protein K2P73_08990 [Lachnospiraceae bacterium]|nr:hypothetical protein [Lachnospiraceae bacterium]